jgi:hypothetical protein
MFFDNLKSFGKALGAAVLCVGAVFCSIPSTEAKLLDSYSWNAAMRLPGILYSTPSQDLYTASDIAQEVSKTSDFVFLQEIWNDTDASSIISELAQDYPYYVRPASLQYKPNFCSPSSSLAVQNVFQCFARNNISSPSFSNIAPCVVEIQGLVDLDESCARCFVVQLLTDSTNRTRQLYNTGSAPPAINPVDLVFDRCVLNPDKYASSLHGALYENNPGLLLLSKKPVQTLTGKATKQGKSSKISRGLVKTSQDIVQYHNSSIIVRASIEAKINGAKVFASHFPFKFGVVFPGEEKQEDIFDKVLNKQQKAFDVLLGDFNSGIRYQPEGYSTARSNGYSRLYTVGWWLPQKEDPIVPRRNATYCHNRRHTACANVAESSYQLDIDSFYLPNHLWSVLYRSYPDNYLSLDFIDNQFSDHVAIRSWIVV